MNVCIKYSDVRCVLYQRIDTKHLAIRDSVIYFGHTSVHCQYLTDHPDTVIYHLTYQVPYLPLELTSPILITCGQCCNVLAKNGLVTPKTTDGLKT